MRTQYIHFTEAQKEQARHTDLAALLESKGETVKKQGKEYVWRNGSDRITLRGNLWFNHYERVGGDAVDFVRRFYDKDFPSAINFLLGESGGNILPNATVPTKPFELPPKNDNSRRALHDLRKAGLVETEQRYRTKGGKSSSLFKIQSG